MRSRIEVAPFLAMFVSSLIIFGSIVGMLIYLLLFLLH